MKLDKLICMASVHFSTCNNPLYVVTTMPTIIRFVWDMASFSLSKKERLHWKDTCVCLIMATYCKLEMSAFKFLRKLNAKFA